MKNATLLFLSISACLMTFIATKNYDKHIMKKEIKQEVEKEIEGIYHLLIFQSRQIDVNTNFHHQTRTIIENLHGEGSLTLSPTPKNKQEQIK